MIRRTAPVKRRRHDASMRRLGGSSTIRSMSASDEVRDQLSRGDDGSGGGLAEVVERVDADRHGEQRAGTQPIGGGGGRAHRHLHQRIGATLSSGAHDAVAEVGEAELFAEAVQLGLEDLPTEGIEHPVDDEVRHARPTEADRCRP